MFYTQYQSYLYKIKFLFTFYLQFYHILQFVMIQKKNYQKICQYSNNCMKAYAKRSIGLAVLKMLEKKRLQSVSQLPNQSKIQTNRNQAHHGNYIEIGTLQQNEPIRNDENSQINKKNANLDRCTISSVQQIVPVCYGDFIYLESYKVNEFQQQKLRVVSTLNKLHATSIRFLQGVNPRRFIFQIVNPCSITSQFKHGFDTYTGIQRLMVNNIFCLKNIFTEKYLSVSHQINNSYQFGEIIQLQQKLSKTSIFRIVNDSSSNDRTIRTQQSVCIRFQNDQSLYLNISKQPLQYQFNVIAYKKPFNFKIAKVKNESYVQKIPYFRIKNVQFQLYMGCNYLDINNYFNRKAHANTQFTTQQDKIIKLGSLTFDEYQQFKKVQTQVRFKAFDKSNVNLLWFLQKTSDNNYKLVHASTSYCLAIKNNKNLKITSQQSDNSNIFIVKSELNQNYVQIRCNEHFILSTSFDEQTEKYQLIVQQYLPEKHSSKQQNQSMFQLEPISLHQSQILMQLIEIRQVMKKIYKFFQKVGFEKKPESLLYSVQQIKKQMPTLEYRIFQLNACLKKLHNLFQQQSKKISKSGNFSQKLENLCQTINIFQLMVKLCKIMVLKMGKTIQIESNIGTPFSIVNKLLQQTLKNIFAVMEQFVYNSKQCSNVIIFQAHFFNSLLDEYPEIIGEILQQTIRNLSFFSVTMTRNQDGYETFQWARLIDSVTESTVKIQKIYIDIIAEVLVDPQDKGIISYQNKCKQLLFAIQTTKRKTLPKFNVDSNKPIIIFENNSNMKNFLQNNQTLAASLPLVSKQSASFYLEDFFIKIFDKQKIQQYLEYIYSVLRLMRNLCKNRNKKLLKVVEDWGLTTNHIYQVINCSNIGWEMKAAYLNLFCCIYIDQDPFLPFNLKQVKCHVWNRIGQYDLNQKTAMIFKQYTDYAAAFQKFRDFDQQILPIIDLYFKEFDEKIKTLNLKKKDYWCFTTIIKVIYEAINFGYLDPINIKQFVKIIINRTWKLKELEKTASAQKQTDNIIVIVTQIINIYEEVMVTLQGIDFIIKFQKNRLNKKQALTYLQTCQYWKNKLKNRISFQGFKRERSMQNCKKKTTFKSLKNISYSYKQNPQLSNSQASWEELDLQILSFLLKIFLTYKRSQSSSTPANLCFKKVIDMICNYSSRNQKIQSYLSSLMFLNNTKEEQIYKDFNGREPGKMLNCLKIRQLVVQVIRQSKQTSKQHRIADNEEQKRKRQKILELKNLLVKIVREIKNYKKQSFGLFKKAQQIIEKLQVHKHLITLLQYTDDKLYYDLLMTVLDFYIQFIDYNPQNCRALIGYFPIFLNNIKFTKVCELITILYRYTENQLETFSQLCKLLEKKSSKLIRQNILQTIYKIIKSQTNEKVLKILKNNFIISIIKRNQFETYLNSENYLSPYFICVLCEAIQDSQMLLSKLKNMFHKNKLIDKLTSKFQFLCNSSKQLQQDALNIYYQRKAINLKLFYYFYLKVDGLGDIVDDKDLIYIVRDMIIPEYQQLMTVIYALYLKQTQTSNSSKLIENKDIENKSATNFGNLIKANSFKEISQHEIKFNNIKNYFAEVSQNTQLISNISAEQADLDSYWNFVLSPDDPNQICLLNFSEYLISELLNQDDQNLNQLENTLSKICGLMNMIIEEIKDKQYPHQNFLPVSSKICLLQLAAYQKIHKDQQKIPEPHTQDEKAYVSSFFMYFAEAVRQQQLSFTDIIQCFHIDQMLFLKKRAGCQIEQLIGEQQFLQGLRMLQSKIFHQYEFSKLISTNSVFRLFTILQESNSRKIDIFDFMDKLIKELEYLKTLEINNNVFDRKNQINQQEYYQAETQNKYSYPQTERIKQQQISALLKEINYCLSHQLSGYSYNLMQSQFQKLLNYQEEKLALSKLLGNNNNHFFNIHQIYSKIVVKPQIVSFLLATILKQCKANRILIKMPNKRYIHFLTSDIISKLCPYSIDILGQLALNFGDQQTIQKILDSFEQILAQFLKVLVNCPTDQYLKTFQKFFSFLEKIITNHNVPQAFIQKIQKILCDTLIIWLQQCRIVNNLYWAKIINLILQTFAKSFENCQYTATCFAQNKSIRNWFQTLFSKILVLITSTNIVNCIQLKYLHLIMQIFMKFNAKMYQTQLKLIFYHLPFKQLIEDIDYLYLRSIKPKLPQFETGKFCRKYQECSREFCNNSNFTNYDQYLLDIIIQILIILQLSVQLFIDEGNEFRKRRQSRNQTFSIDKQNQEALLIIKKLTNPQIQRSLSNQYSQKSLIKLYTNFLGTIQVNLASSKVNQIYFKLPYISRLNNKKIKQGIMDQINCLEAETIYQYIYPLSIVFQKQLEDNKRYSSIPVLSILLHSENTVNGILRLVSILTYALYFLGISQIMVYVLIAFSIFGVLLKSLYSITLLRTTINYWVNFHSYKFEKQPKLSKISLFNRKMLNNILVLLLYIVSLVVPDVYPALIIVQITTLQHSAAFLKAVLFSFINTFEHNFWYLWILLFIYSVETEYSAMWWQTFYEFNNEIGLLIFRGTKISDHNEFPIFRNNFALLVLSCLLFILFQAAFISGIIIYYSKINNEEKLRNSMCQICLRARGYFDTKTTNFEHHLKYEHNLWNYLYYFINLRSKKSEQSTDIEIKKKIQLNNFLFLKLHD